MADIFAINEITRILGIFILSLILSSAIYTWIKSRKYPPGPIGLPLVGYAFSLGENPHEKLRDLSKKYGDIFSFYIGNRLNICVTDYHLIKDILTHPNTLSRPPHAFQFLIGKGGILGLNGEIWKDQRRFVMYTIRNLGVGKGIWETMIQEDVSEFVNDLKKLNGEPFYFDEPLSRSQITNEVSLLFGRHLNKETDKEDIEVMINFGKLMLEHMSSVDINLNVPELSHLFQFLNLKSIQNFMHLLKKYQSIFEREVNMRIEKKVDIVKDDFIGCYLTEIEKRGEDAESQGFTVTTLMGNLLILLVAGTDSTVAGVGWLLVLMAKHQDIQKKICNEIDQAIGRDGTVYYDDKMKMPYTTAAILEMLRWSSISAIFPPRYVAERFTFNGYEIPERSHIISNNWAMMHDPRYFDEPMEYRPERFLEKDNTVKFTKVEGYGPFSFGKRNCPGDGIATMTIYLYFVSIMQKFNIKAPNGYEPDLTYRYAGGVLPNKQNLCFIER